MTRVLELAPTLVPWLLVVLGLGAQIYGLRSIIHGALHPIAPIVAESAWDESGSDSSAYEMPIAGTTVPTAPDLLPGAARAYRGGRHEGVDFRCAPGTPVRAAADGFVLSLQDEPNLPEDRRTLLLGICQRRRETPEEVLQVLHGRRIVICHGTRGGELVTTSYSHLQGIAGSIQPGTDVRQDEVIGWAGASGTSHAYRGDGWGELHFELRINGRPLGLGLPAGEAAAIYRRYLGAAAHD